MFPSIFYWELRNIYCKCHNHQRLHKWIHSVGISLRVEKCLLHMPLSPKKYFQGEFFFVVYFSSLKPSVVFFFTDRIWNYWWKLCRRTHSIGDLVGKKITDEVVISHQRIFSVSKTVKCCSAPTPFPIILIQEDDLLRCHTRITRLLGLSSYIEKKFNKKKHTWEWPGCYIGIALWCYLFPYL